MSELTPAQKKDEEIIDKNIDDEVEAIESYQNAKEELSTEKGKARAAEIQDDEREHKEELEELKIGKSFREMFNERRSAVYDKAMGIEHFEKKGPGKKNVKMNDGKKNMNTSTPPRGVLNPTVSHGQGKNSAAQEKKETKREKKELENKVKEADVPLPDFSTKTAQVEAQIMAAVDENIDTIKKILADGKKLKDNADLIKSMANQVSDLRAKHDLLVSAQANTDVNAEHLDYAKQKLDEFNADQKAKEDFKNRDHKAYAEELGKTMKDLEETLQIMKVWTSPDTMGPVMLKEKVAMEGLINELKGQIDREIGLAAKEEHMKKYLTAAGIKEINRDAMPHRTRFPSRRIIDMLKGKYGDVIEAMKQKGYTAAQLRQEWDELDPDRANANPMSDFLDPRNRNKMVYDKTTGEGKIPENTGNLFGLSAKESGGYSERRHYPQHRLVSVTVKNDENGQPHYYVDYVEKRRVGSRWNQTYETDDNGFVVMDENGNPRMRQRHQGLTTKPTREGEDKFPTADGKKLRRGSAEAKQKRYLTQPLQMTENGEIAVDELGNPIVADDDENGTRWFGVDNFSPGDTRTIKIHHQHEIPKKNVEFIKNKKGKVIGMYYREAIGKDAKGKTIWAPVLNGWRYYSMSNVGKDYLKLSRYFPNHNANVQRVIAWMESINATAEKMRAAGYEDVESPFEDMSYLDMSDAAQEAVIFKEVFNQDIDIMGVKFPKTIKINTYTTLDDEQMRVARIDQAQKYTYAVIHALCNKFPKTLSPSQIHVMGEPVWENGELQPPQIFITGIDSIPLQRILTREFYRLFEGTANDSARSMGGYDTFEQGLLDYEEMTGDNADAQEAMNEELRTISDNYKLTLKRMVEEKQDTFWNNVCDELGLDKNNLDRRWGGLRDNEGNPVTVSVPTVDEFGNPMNIQVTLNKKKDVDQVNLFLKGQAQDELDKDEETTGRYKLVSGYLQYLFNENYKDEILENYTDEIYAEMIHRKGITDKLTPEELEKTFMSLPTEEKDAIIKAARDQVSKKYPFVRESSYANTYRMWQNWPEEKQEEELAWYKDAVTDRDKRKAEALKAEEDRLERLRMESSKRILAEREAQRQASLKEQYNLHARMGRQYAEKLGIELGDSDEDTKKAVELFDRIAEKRAKWNDTLKRIDEENLAPKKEYDELVAERNRILTSIRVPSQFDPQGRTLFHLFKQAKGDPEHLQGLSGKAADKVVADAQDILNKMFKTFLKPQIIQQLYDTYKEAGMRHPKALKNLSEKAENLQSIYEISLYNPENMYEHLLNAGEVKGNGYTDGYTVFEGRKFKPLTEAYNAMLDIIIGAQDKANGTDNLNTMLAQIGRMNETNPDNTINLTPNNNRYEAWQDLDDETKMFVPEEKEVKVEEPIVEAYDNEFAPKEVMGKGLDERAAETQRKARESKVEEPKVEEKETEKPVIEEKNINVGEVKDKTDLKRQMGNRGKNSQNKAKTKTKTVTETKESVTPVGTKKDTAGGAQNKQAQKEKAKQEKLNRKADAMVLTSEKKSVRSWNGMLVYADDSVINTSFRKMMTRSFKKGDDIAENFGPKTNHYDTHTVNLQVKSDETRKKPMSAFDTDYEKFLRKWSAKDPTTFRAFTQWMNDNHVPYSKNGNVWTATPLGFFVNYYTPDKENQGSKSHSLRYAVNASAIDAYRTKKTYFDPVYEYMNVYLKHAPISLKSKKMIKRGIDYYHTQPKDLAITERINEVKNLWRKAKAEGNVKLEAELGDRLMNLTRMKSENLMRYWDSHDNTHTRDPSGIGERWVDEWYNAIKEVEGSVSPNMNHETSYFRAVRPIDSGEESMFTNDFNGQEAVGMYKEKTESQPKVIGTPIEIPKKPMADKIQTTDPKLDDIVTRNSGAEAYADSTPGQKIGSEIGYVGPSNKVIAGESNRKIHEPKAIRREL